MSKEAFLRFFPNPKIDGDEEKKCKNGGDCEECGRRCGQSIKMTQGASGFVISNDYPTHQIGEFKWEWSGHGATEHWFDEARNLKSTDDYRSGSGRTAHSVRIVAYKRHVKVQSFRYGLTDAQIFPKFGNVWAEFKNAPSEYRANWTGFALGYMPKDEHGCIDPVPVVSDDLDAMVEAMLAGDVGEPVVCKHNQNVQVHVLTADPSKVSYLLCKACRMQGVKVAEFTGRNRMDTCPYFRRACKGVVEKSDPFPGWFEWSGDNLLSSALRMQDGEHAAYEVAYIRRKDGFIRRAVLLINERTKEVWMYRYNGFVPRTVREFFGKYAEGRQISGYMGTGPAEYCPDPEDRFLSEIKIAAEVAECMKQPLWQNGDAMFLSFEIGCHEDKITHLASQNVQVGYIQIARLNRDGEPCEMKDGSNPTPFYADKEADYFLIRKDWAHNAIVLRHSHGAELYRTKECGYSKFFLLRIAKEVEHETLDGNDPVKVPA
ncbi:MAG: hypothetical protein WA103_01005 [Minisyncoccales bacterium]